MITGSCLCGAVTFRVGQSLETSDACHCVQCRKWTGHYLASVEVKRANLTVEGDEALRWFHSSAKVRRGFCGRCGSSLFFDPLDTVKHDWLGVSLGAIDGASGTTLQRHIFVAEKGDYYELTDGLPCNAH